MEKHERVGIKMESRGSQRIVGRGEQTFRHMFI